MKTRYFVAAAALALHGAFGQSPPIQDDYYRDAARQEAFLKQSVDFYRRDDAKAQQLAELNPQWHLRKLWPEGDQLQPIFAAALSDDGKTVYFLTHDDFDYQLMAFNGDEVRLVATFPPPSDTKFANQMFGWSITVAGSHLLISDGVLLWHGVAGTDSIFREVAKIPFAVKAAWVAGDRIFILSKNDLLSTDFNGRNRRTHFSASQADKTLTMQREDTGMSFRYGCAGATGDSALLLALRKNKTELLSYGYGDGEIKTVATLPEMNFELWDSVFRHGDKIFITRAMNSDSVNCYLFQYTISDGSLRPLAYREKIPLRAFPGNNFDPQQALRLDNAHRVGGGYLAQGKTLCYFGIKPPRFGQQRDSMPGSAGIIDLEQYPDGPVLKLPSVNALFPFPDGRSLVAVEYYQLTAIHLQPRPVTE